MRSAGSPLGWGLPRSPLPNPQMMKFYPSQVIPNMNRRFLCLAACLFAAPLSAHAAVLALEDFTYADGSLAGSNGGFGWSTTWSNIVGTTATAAGGEANITSTPGSEVVRTLASTQSGSATIWICFQAQQFTTLSGSTNSFGGFGLYNGSTEQLLIGKAWPGPYEWRAGTGGGLVGPASPVSSLNLTTVLARVTLNTSGNDTLDVWLNPADMSSESALGAASITRTDADLNFDRVRLRGGSGAGGTESWQFDNLVISTTLAEVPEPSSVLLGGLGVLALIRRRRR